MRWLVWIIPVGLAVAFPYGLNWALDLRPTTPPPPPEISVRAQQIVAPKRAPVVTRGSAAMDSKQVSAAAKSEKKRYRRRSSQPRLTQAQKKAIDAEGKRAWREAAERLASGSER